MGYVTYIDQKRLKKLNDKAIRQDRNRTLRQSFVKSIDKDLRMPLVADMPHNDREMRCVFLFVEKTSCSRPSQNIHGHNTSNRVPKATRVAVGNVRR